MISSDHLVNAVPFLIHVSTVLEAIEPRRFARPLHLVPYILLGGGGAAHVAPPPLGPLSIVGNFHFLALVGPKEKCRCAQGYFCHLQSYGPGFSRAERQHGTARGQVESRNRIQEKNTTIGRAAPSDIQMIPATFPFFFHLAFGKQVC